MLSEVPVHMKEVFDWLQTAKQVPRMLYRIHIRICFGAQYNSFFQMRNPAPSYWYRSMSHSGSWYLSPPYESLTGIKLQAKYGYETELAIGAWMHGTSIGDILICLKCSRVAV
ncbi:hypothetical protein TNCV_781201 [Trichonephila clavipes]|nr:hypothetical protein TNCV_781201 [Trichonephila clavipes]